MTGFDYDLCIIGGGVNGAGIARDAAGRGLSVLVLEAKDLACATSSSSTKLIHGGLRYLEFFEFRLVADSLREREVLLGIAPHIIRPLDFILPHDRGQRPWWLIRLGLFLYDHLAPRKALHRSYSVDFDEDWRGNPLIATYEKGFCYADCWVDDSRLVVLNAMDAASRGAKILNYHKCTKISEERDGWKIQYTDQKANKNYSASASMVVNAAGPWVSEIIEMAALKDNSPKTRLVKGSHIIINRAFEGDHAYILQQKDKRIVFAIPYEHEYTLVGTTEEAFEGDLYDPRISDAELTYLCDAFSTHFKKDIERQDVLWTYSGVRPLFDDGGDKDEARTVTRDYVLHTHSEVSAPFLSVFGGKLTTFRVLAEQAVNRLLHLDNRYSPSWTKDAPLPGGDFPAADFPAFLDGKREEYPWIPEDILRRYARSYGTYMDRFLSGASGLKDLGEDFGAGLSEAEISYLVRFEFARELDDILWRRTKIGMHMSDKEIEKLEKQFPEILVTALKP
jgi:glycerol-3-phosphate dehydrogenase